MRIPRVLTPHPHDREILRLAIPAFGALVAEPLFLLGDSAIVGRLGTAPLGGLGVASTVLTTLVGVCVFLAYATTAAVARRLGAGDLTKAIRQGIDGIWLAIGIGLAVIAIGWPTAPLLVQALGASAEVYPHALTYLQISLFGAPAMLLVLAGTGVLRGLQDTRTPLIVAVAAFTANLVLNAWFVLGLGWGIAGSAIGTVVAQYGAAFAYIVITLRGAARHGVISSSHRVIRELKPDLHGIRASAAAGFALAIRTVAMRVVIVIAAAVAARLGDAEIAAHQVAFATWSLLAFALDAVAIAGQAIVGRYLGAADVIGTRNATRRMIEWGIGVGVVLGLLVLAGSPILPALFSGDPDVRSLLTATLVVAAILQPLAGVVFALDGILIGAGDMRYLAYAGLASTVAFLPAAYVVLLLDAGLVGLWWAIGAWMFARFVTLTARVRGSAWMVTGPVRA